MLRENRERGGGREKPRGEKFVPRWFEKCLCDVTGEESWWWKGGEYRNVREKVGRGEGRGEGLEEIF